MLMTIETAVDDERGERRGGKEKILRVYIAFLCLYIVEYD